MIAEDPQTRVASPRASGKLVDEMSLSGTCTLDRELLTRRLQVSGAIVTNERQEFGIPARAAWNRNSQFSRCSPDVDDVTLSETCILDREL